MLTQEEQERAAGTVLICKLNARGNLIAIPKNVLKTFGLKTGDEVLIKIYTKKSLTNWKTKIKK